MQYNLLELRKPSTPTSLDGTKQDLSGMRLTETIRMLLQRRGQPMTEADMQTKHQPRVEIIQIGEVAKQTALTVDAIQFYERRRMLPKAVRSTGRFRLYTKDDVRRLHFIRQMQGLGFSLREAGELSELRERKVDACESIRELLKAKLADVLKAQRP